MFIYAKYWKDEFFQRRLRVNPGQVEKYVIKTRKVRTSAETGIRKILLLLSNNLWTKFCSIKKKYRIWLRIMGVMNFSNQTRQR